MKKVFKGLLLGVLAIAMVLSMFACADKVDVTFKDGDTVVATVTVEKGKALSEADFPEAPVKEGYKFLGWYADDTELTAETLISGAVTFVAKYEEEVAQATVTFKSEGATVSTESVAVGTALTVADFPADPTLADHTFLGWYIGETKVEAGYTVTADVTVTAKFAHNTAKVIFKSGDTVLGEKTLNTKTALTAADFPTDPTLADSVFLGWYVGETKVEAGYVVTADVTVTAKFTSDIAKVTFKNGETVLGGLVKVVNDTLTAADFPADPTLAGHHFIGWYVGEEKISAGYTVTADVTVTAKFASDTVKVTFKDGETTLGEVTKATGDALVAADFPADPTLADHTFLGWYIGETKVEAGYTVTADVTATAKFARDVAKVIFKYGDTTLDEKTVETNTALTAADFPADPTLAGHHFVGWYVGEEKISAGYTVTADVTVTAKFEKNIYKVSFVVDGEEFASLDVPYGETPDENDLPGDPEKVGHEFDGWFAGEDAFDEEAAVKADITYTAQFTKTAWKVTFTSDGAEPQDFYVPMDDAKLTLDQIPVALADTKTAHFHGWYHGTTKAKVGLDISEDTVFTAKFVTVDSFTGEWYNEENAYFFTINGKKVKVAGAECDALFDEKAGRFSIKVDSSYYYDYVFTVAEDGESLSLVRSIDEYGEGDWVASDPVLMSALPEGGFTGVYRASNSETYTVENGVIVKYGTSDSVVYYGTILPDGNGGYRLVYKSGKTTARAEYTVTVDEKGNWHVTEVGKTRTKIYVANPTEYTYIYCSATDSASSETIHIFTLADETKLFVWTQGDATDYVELAIVNEERGLYTFTRNSEEKTVKVDIGRKSFIYPGAEAATYGDADGVDLKLDGFGYAMLGEVEYTYVLNNGCLKLFDLASGEFRFAFTLDTAARTYAAREKDAFAGEYEYYVDFIQKEKVVITLDGYGTATYVYNNGSPTIGLYTIVDGKITFQNVEYNINRAGAFTPSADGKVLTGVYVDYHGDKVRLELKNTTALESPLDESLFGWYANEDETVIFRLYKTATDEMFIEGLYDEKVVACAYWDGTAVYFEAIDTCSEKPGSPKPKKTFYFYLSDGGAVLHHSCDVMDADSYLSSELKKVSYKKLAEAPAVNFPTEVCGKTWYNEDNLTLVLSAPSTLTLGGEEAKELRFFGTYYAFRIGETEYVLLVKDGKVYLGTSKANAALLSDTPAPNKYTVTFVDEEGNVTGTAKVIEGDYLKEADIPDALTKTDAAFLGWYCGDDKAVTGTTTVTADMTFTAKFRNKADYVGTWVDTDKKILLDIGDLLFKGDISGSFTFSTVTGNLSYLKVKDNKKVTVELSSDGKSVTYTVYEYDGEEDFVFDAAYTLTKLEKIFDGQNKYQGTSGSEIFTVEENGYISKVGSSFTIYGLVTVEEDGSYKLEYKATSTGSMTTLFVVKDADGNLVAKDKSKIYVKGASSLTSYSNKDAAGKYEYLHVYTMTDGSTVVVYRSTENVSNYATVEGTIAEGNIITFTAGEKTATVKLVKGSYGKNFAYPTAEKGTYTAEGGSVLTLDGFGNATLGEKSYTYLVSDTLVVLSAEGEEEIGFTLDMANHTYTAAQKIGYKGTYNVWQNYQKTADTTLTLDGYGNAILVIRSTTYTGTYAVSADGKSMTFKDLDFAYNRCTWTLSHDGNAMSTVYNNGNDTKYEIVNADYAPTAADLSAYVDKYYADATGDAFYLSYNEHWKQYEFAFWLDSSRDFWAVPYWDGEHFVFGGVDFDTSIEKQETESRSFLVSFEGGKITLTHRCANGFDDNRDVTFGFVSVTYTECEQPAVYIADELLGTWYTAEGSTVVIAKNKVIVNGVESTELNATVYYGITYTALVGGIEYTLTYDDYGKAVCFGATALFAGELPVLLTSMPDDATNPFLGKWNPTAAMSASITFEKQGKLLLAPMVSVPYAVKLPLCSGNVTTAYILWPSESGDPTVITATISGNTMTMVAVIEDEEKVDTYTKDGAEPEEPVAEHDGFYGEWKDSNGNILTFEDGNKVTYNNGTAVTETYTLSEDGKTATFSASAFGFVCKLADDGASLSADMDDGDVSFTLTFTKQ